MLSLFTSPIHSQFCSYPSPSMSFARDSFIFMLSSLPGLTHSSFLQEDADVFFAAIEQMCSFILTHHWETLQIQENKFLNRHSLKSGTVKNNLSLSKSTQWDEDTQTQHTQSRSLGYEAQCSGAHPTFFSVCSLIPHLPWDFLTLSFLQLLSPLPSQDATFLHFHPMLSSF